LFLFAVFEIALKLAGFSAAGNHAGLSGDTPKCIRTAKIKRGFYLSQKLWKSPYEISALYEGFL
jgi:hypothetical protein